MKNIKYRYNKWLYKKYGVKCGPLFENIPFIFRLRPLFSPSLYFLFSCDDINSGLRASLITPNIPEHLKNDFKEYSKKLINELGKYNTKGE